MGGIQWLLSVNLVERNEKKEETRKWRLESWLTWFQLRTYTVLL